MNREISYLIGLGAVKHKKPPAGGKRYILTRGEEMKKQYTLEVCRYSDGELVYYKDYYTKEELKSDLKMFNSEFCDIKIFFSKFDGTDEFVELDVERF